MATSRTISYEALLGHQLVTIDKSPLGFLPNATNTQIIKLLIKKQGLSLKNYILLLKLFAEKKDRKNKNRFLYFFQERKTIKLSDFYSTHPSCLYISLSSLSVAYIYTYAHAHTHTLYHFTGYVDTSQGTEVVLCLFMKIEMTMSKAMQW